MSSLEAQPWYDEDDWQLFKTDHSYEGSKYQIDLIASKLAKRSLEAKGEADAVRHYLVHPGVVHSNMTNGMIFFFFDMCKVILFYIVRFLVHSPNRYLADISRLGTMAWLAKSYNHSIRIRCVCHPFRISLNPRCPD